MCYLWTTECEHKGIGMIEIGNMSALDLEALGVEVTLEQLTSTN